MHAMSIPSLTLLLICCASEAVAHASLLEAVPGPDARVGGDSVSIELRFDSRLDPRFSRLKLVRSDNSPATLILRRGMAPSVLSATSQGLDEGQYILRWQVLSVDGHANQGEIKFQVGR
ncbi:MAG: copper resistance CopC family protein [Methylocystis sp.]|uniref:copper resistance CopC family protein n=1 Tax=Methylocystis sp. TaxID=1911079 RepID=UPI003DA4CE94